MRRLFIGLLAALLLYLQARLWVGEGSITEILSLQEQIRIQQRGNNRLQQRNSQLAGEIIALQNGLQAVEAQARQQLGMTRRDETFYLVYD